MPNASPGRAFGSRSSPRLPRVVGVRATSTAARLAAVAALAFILAIRPEPAKAGPAFEMEQFQLVLLLRPADRKAIPESEAEAIQKQHIAHLEKMARSGKMVVAGPFDAQRDPTLRGACIYRVATPEEARALAEADPAVQAGRLRVEVVTWYVGKGYMTFPKAPPGESGAVAPGPTGPASSTTPGGAPGAAPATTPGR
jgi:uncharacterized protein YciI